MADKTSDTKQPQTRKQLQLCCCNMRSCVLIGLLIFVIAYICQYFLHFICQDPTYSNELNCFQKIFVKHIFDSIFYGSLVIPYALSKWGFGEFNDNFASVRSLVSPNLTFLFKDIINLEIKLDYIVINEIPVYTYSPLNSTKHGKPEPLIIYFHGGGGTSLYAHFFDATMRYLSHKASMRVFAIDYPHSPEVLFPQIQENCFSLVRYIFENNQEFKVDKRKIVIGGDSFGGHVSLYIAFKWKELDVARNLAPISSIFLIYPWVQFLRPDTPLNERGIMANSSLDMLSVAASIHISGKLDLVPYITNTTLHMLSSQFSIASERFPELVIRKDWHPESFLYLNYSKYADILLNPYGSFLFQEDFSSLPPTILICAEYDKLLNENLLLAERLREAGVPVTIKTFEKFFHGFTTIVLPGDVIPSTNEAWTMIASHIQKYLN